MSDLGAGHVPGEKRNDYEAKCGSVGGDDDERHHRTTTGIIFLQARLRGRGHGRGAKNGTLLAQMATVAQLLEQKGHNVESISPNATVYDAIRRMADLDIGALVVIDGGKVVGLISERDYARNVFLKGKASPTTPVRDAMTDDVLFVGCGETARDCMAIMTGKRTRHLLVMEGGELLGIVSIGDLVRSIVAEQDKAIEQLEQYIHRG